MGAGGILAKCFKTTFSILKNNIVTVLLIVLVVSLPLWAVDFFCISTICDFEEITEHINAAAATSENAGSSEEELTSELRADMQKLMIYYALELVLSLLGVLQTGAIVIFTKRKIDAPGSGVNAMGVLEDAAAVFPKVMLAELIVAFSVALGLFAFVFPGLLIFAFNAFTVPATALRKSFGKGRADSFSVFRKNMGASVLTLLISVGIPVAITYSVSLMASLLSRWYWVYAVVSAISFVFLGVVESAGTIFRTAFYLDRTEIGFEEEKVSK